jgi:homoaconitase/3-isopropylmalate dehydratase large subunit
LRNEFEMTEFQWQNGTILHTEFYRQRTEPGMIAVGAESHTCSLGTLRLRSIGLGAADVTIMGDLVQGARGCGGVGLSGSHVSVSG